MLADLSSLSIVLQAILAFGLGTWLSREHWRLMLCVTCNRWKPSSTPKKWMTASYAGFSIIQNCAFLVTNVTKNLYWLPEFCSWLPAGTYLVMIKINLIVKFNLIFGQSNCIELMFHLAAVSKIKLRGSFLVYHSHEWILPTVWEILLSAIIWRGFSLQMYCVHMSQSCAFFRYCAGRMEMIWDLSVICYGLNHENQKKLHRSCSKNGWKKLCKGSHGKEWANAFYYPGQILKYAKKIIAQVIACPSPCNLIPMVSHLTSPWGKRSRVSQNLGDNN